MHHVPAATVEYSTGTLKEIIPNRSSMEEELKFRSCGVGKVNIQSNKRYAANLQLFSYAL